MLQGKQLNRGSSEVATNLDCRAAHNTEGTKLDLQHLILIDAKVTRLDEDLNTSGISPTEPAAPPTDSTRAIGIMTAPVVLGDGKAESAALAPPAPVNVSSPLDIEVKPAAHREAEAHLLGLLHECAQAVGRFSTALERAITQLSVSEAHTPGCLQGDFINLQAIFNRVTWHECALEIHWNAQSTVSSTSGPTPGGLTTATEDLQTEDPPANSNSTGQSLALIHGAARAPAAVTSRDGTPRTAQLADCITEPPARKSRPAPQAVDVTNKPSIRGQVSPEPAQSQINPTWGLASSSRRALKRTASEKRATIIRSSSSSGETIERLPSTTPKPRTDSPDSEPETQQHFVSSEGWSAATLPPSPSSKTLRPSRPSRNLLLAEDDEEGEVDTSTYNQTTKQRRAAQEGDQIELETLRPAIDVVPHGESATETFDAPSPDGGRLIRSVFVSENATAYYGPSYDPLVIDMPSGQPSEHAEDLGLSLNDSMFLWQTSSSGWSHLSQEGVGEDQLAGLNLNTQCLDIAGYGGFQSFDWISAPTVHVGSTSASDENSIALANKLLREWTTIEI